MSKELFDSLLTAVDKLIQEYGVLNKYALEEKQSAGDVQYSIYKFQAEGGNSFYKGDVDSIEILIQAFNKQQLLTYNTNGLNSSAPLSTHSSSTNINEKYLERFHSLLTALENIHRQGPNIPGFKFVMAPRYSQLQKICENLAHSCKNLWLHERDKKLSTERAQLEEEKKQAQQQHDQFTETLAAQKEQRKKEREEKRKKENDELTAQLKQEVLQFLIEKTSEDKHKLMAEYEAKIALLESNQRDLLSRVAAKDAEIAELTLANETLNQTLLEQTTTAPHLQKRSSGAQRLNQTNSSFFQTGHSDEKEVDELQKRIGTIHAKYVRCLTKFSKLPNEPALSTKAKESLMQLLVNYEKHILEGTTQPFKNITLQNIANQEMVQKTLEEMAFLEKQDSEEKHKTTIDKIHDAEKPTISNKPLLTPQIQVLGKIIDFVVGYDKKPASQMIGTIPELNLALEEKNNAMRIERKKQIAQQSATAATPAAVRP